MGRLIQLIYSSAPSPDFAEHEIPALLKAIRPANAGHQITGLLLYTTGAFIQLLEGNAEAVEAVYRRITADARHRDVRLLAREPIAERAFADWTMDFLNVDPFDAAALVGEPGLFAPAADPRRITLEHARKLLFALKRSSWQKRAAPSPLPRRA